MNPSMKTKKHKPVSSVIHKWIGLLTSIIILTFCISGLILNHRALFSSFSVSRGIMPSEYHIENFNNGIIKGTTPFNNGIIAFGNSGLWRTDKGFSSFTDFNSGLPEGPDNRNVRNVVKTKDGTLWCVTQFGLYRHNGLKWVGIQLPDCKERIADLTLNRDSTSVVVLTRSAVYPLSDGGFSRIELKKPEGYSHKVSMFKTLWMLHSGELFGLTGRIIVDLLAIILIFLCITGIILFIMPSLIKREAPAKRLSKARLFKWNFKWHDKIGYITIIFTILICFTGMCLRPPMMIPFVIAKTSPLPGSQLDSDNVWHDKLRGIRWNETDDNWLISTSEGFITADETFGNVPLKIESGIIPPVSPMGINVFEPLDSGEWLIGSFSGMYLWNPRQGTVKDYFTQKNLETAKAGRPTSDHLVSGYSKDLDANSGIVFDYAKGSSEPLPTPDILRHQPMSLWNFALELHVGRCYNPILGPFSSIFIFMAGAIFITVLVSGLIIHRRHKNHKQ